MNDMQAYHNNSELKKQFLAQIRAHAAADEIVKGQYWEDGKGCAVGCTIYDSDHSKYETELGVPEVLARLEDVIFEGLSNGEAKAFPERFLKSIPVGADLSRVGIQFQIALQERNYERLDKKAFPEVEKAIQATLEVLRNWLHGKLDKSAARSAAESAESAARSAESAESAAWSARSARSAAESAESAARSAESAAWSARSARSAAESAESAEYTWMAEKLIELLEGAE